MADLFTLFIPTGQISVQGVRIAKLIRLWGTGPHVLVRLLGPRMRRYAREDFATEGSTGGSRWKPLTRAYARKKREAVGRKKILKYTSELWRSLVLKDHPKHIERVRGVFFEFGTKDPKGKWHLKGRRAPTFMPSRPPVRITLTRRAEMIALVKAYFGSRVSGI